MSDTMSTTPTLPPPGDEERDAHIAPVLAGTPAPQPGAPPSAEQAVKRERVPRWRRVTLVSLLVVLVLAGGTGVLVVLLHSPTTSPSAFHPAACPFKPAAGVVQGKDVQCGYLTVPTDHSRPQGPTIRLAVAIFKSTYTPAAAEPVLVLEGGPGTPGLAYNAPYYTPDNIGDVWLGDRDLILLDQRGVGYSQPSLFCTEFNTLPNATYLEVLQACHDRLVRQGIHLSDYNTIQNAKDVHDLVHALGYHQVNLYSISYGTRLALTVLRLFPNDIRSVVLDSTAPPQVTLPLDWPANAQRGFETLFQGCAASAYCNQHYPHLQAVFAQVVSDLNAHPATFQATNPQTGQVETATITGDDVVSSLFSALYQTDLIPKLPKAIYLLANHDYLQLAALGGMLNTPSLDSVGMYYSVECGEDYAFTTPQTLDAALQALEPESRHAFDMQQNYAACQMWNVQPVPAVQKQPVTSAIPTLILSGEYDAVTPPVYGRLAEQTLSRSYFFLFPGVGHGVVGRNACGTSLEQNFLDYPTVVPASDCLATLQEPFFE